MGVKNILFLAGKIEYWLCNINGSPGAHEGHQKPGQ